MKDLLTLTMLFAKMGAVTFGGGYAMLPILQRELVDNRSWVTEEELLDYYAIGQSTPGIIAVNTATFIGYKRKGIAGAIFATIGLLIPSIFIITIISAFLENFMDNIYVTYAFNGIRACVFILVLDAVLKLGKKSLSGLFSVSVFIVVLLLSLFTKVSPAILIFAAGVLGIVVSRIQRRDA